MLSTVAAAMNDYVKAYAGLLHAAAAGSAAPAKAPAPAPAPAGDGPLSAVDEPFLQEYMAYRIAKVPARAPI